MSFKIFKLIFAIIFLVSLGKVFSQDSGYLKLSSFTDKEKYSSSDTIKIALKISITEKYHINSYQVNDPTLIETSVSGSSDRIKLLNTYFPEHEKLKFEFSENELNVYEGDITIGLTYLPDKDLENGNYELPLKFNYQACDDRVCYPPKTVNENIAIQIDNANPSNTESNADVFKSINFSGSFFNRR